MGQSKEELDQTFDFSFYHFAFSDQVHVHLFADGRIVGHAWPNPGVCLSFDVLVVELLLGDTGRDYGKYNDSFKVPPEMMQRTSSTLLTIYLAILKCSMWHSTAAWRPLVQLLHHYTDDWPTYSESLRYPCERDWTNNQRLRIQWTKTNDSVWNDGRLEQLDWYLD